MVQNVDIESDAHSYNQLINAFASYGDVKVKDLFLVKLMGEGYERRSPEDERCWS